MVRLSSIFKLKYRLTRLAGTPVSVLTTPGGVKLADVATSAARILNGVADGASSQLVCSILKAHGIGEVRNGSTKSTPSHWKSNRSSDRYFHRRDTEPLLFESSTITNANRNMQKKYWIFSETNSPNRNSICSSSKRRRHSTGNTYNFALKAAKLHSKRSGTREVTRAETFCKISPGTHYKKALWLASDWNLPFHSMDQAYIDLNCREFELSKNFLVARAFPSRIPRA